MGCSCNGNRKCENVKKKDIEIIEEEKNEKTEMILYVVSLLIFAFTFISSISANIKVIMYIVSIILSGYEIIIDGIKNIFKLEFKEDTLMAIAVIAACILGEFIEGTLVMILFKLGEIIEKRAVSKSNKSIEDITKIKSKNANLVVGEEIEIVDSENLKINDVILVKTGELVPVDCKVISGSASVDTSSITGESRPVYIEENDEVLSGFINLNGSLKCVVIKDYKDSMASQIVDLVYEAKNNKGKTEKFITKFSKVYTPVVLVLALLIAVVPSIFGYEAKVWIMRALVFLVASCPCSIVISIPLALYSSIGTISRKGLLIKGTRHIENLAKTDVIAFDKTGTITTGKMKIDKILILGNTTENGVLEYLYNLERHSSHPIASAIENKIDELKIRNEIIVKEVENYEEIAGYGIKGNIDNQKVIIGNSKLLEKENIEIENLKNGGNYLVVNNEVLACITLMEEIREGMDTLISKLKKIGIKKLVMLTGDNSKNANKIAEQVKIDEIGASLLPKDKLNKIEELKENGKVTFIGDGINDSPVLAKADFSISMGEGAEIANNTADSILISNNLNLLADIIKISRKTMKILNFNIIFSLLVKAIVLICGVMGYAPIWLAVFADVGVTLITVLNSVRIK